MSREDLTKALRRLSVGKCTDPKCWDGCAVYNECLAQIVNDAADYIENLEAELADRRWVSVADRLPNVGEPVVVYGVGKTVEIMIMDERGRWWFSEGWFDKDEVFYWMPLPERPNSVKE